MIIKMLGISPGERSATLRRVNAKQATHVAADTVSDRHISWVPRKKVNEMTDDDWSIVRSHNYVSVPLFAYRVRGDEEARRQMCLGIGVELGVRLVDSLRRREAADVPLASLTIILSPENQDDPDGSLTFWAGFCLQTGESL